MVARLSAIPRQANRGRSHSHGVGDKFAAAWSRDTQSFASPQNSTGCRNDCNSAPLPEVFGRYRILRWLGAGGMAHVYLAHDTELDRQVALKAPNLSIQQSSIERERFKREARAAAAIHHPQVCSVFDIGEHEGVCYLTMRYVEGQLLSSHLAAHGRLPANQAARIVSQLADAVASAHERGVVHRDIKPANVFLDPQGLPILMDFGLASVDRRQEDKLTQAGAVMGTPAYMSPEQAAGQVEQVGPASDIYSLGVLLFEMLVGRPPFTGSASEVIGKILYLPPPKPTELLREVNSELEAICLRAMSKRPEHRYASVVEFRQALQNWLAKHDASKHGALKHGASLAPTRTPPRMRWWIAAGVGMLLAIVAWGVYSLVLHTPTGAIEVRFHDENAQVRVLQEGKVLEIIDASTASQIRRLSTGRYELALVGDRNQFIIQPALVQLKRGDHVIVEIFPVERSLVGRAEREPAHPTAAATATSTGKLPLNQLDPSTVSPELRSQFSKTVPRNGELTLVGGISAESLQRPQAGMAPLEPPLFLVLSGDGATLAAMHPGKVVVIWDLATQQSTRYMTMPRYDTTITLSHDGTVLASAGGGWPVRVWSLADGMLQSTHEGHTNWVNTIAFSRDGRLAASSSKDGTVRLWDAANRESLWARPHGDWSRAVAISPDGLQVASGGQKGFVKLWDIASGKLIRTWTASTHPVLHLQFNPAKPTLAVKDETGALTVSSLTYGKPLLRVAMHPLTFPRFSPDGDTIAFATPEGELVLHDSASPTVRFRLPASAKDTVLAPLGFSDDGSHLVVSDSTGGVGIFRLRSTPAP
jgi:hypothetical protein